jgi:hypothetical protein
MNNDRKSRRTAAAIFAVALTVAVIAAFITTFEGVSTETGQQRSAARYDWPSPSPSATRHSAGRACSKLALRYLFKFSDAIVIKSTLSKWLHDAATNTGQPNLVLAMISVLLAATIVFILRGVFG